MTPAAKQRERLRAATRDELPEAHAVAEKLGGGWLARCPAIPSVVERHQFQHEALTRAQGEALRLLRSQP